MFGIILKTDSVTTVLLSENLPAVAEPLHVFVNYSLSLMQYRTIEFIKGLGLFGLFMLDISSLKYLHDM